MRKMPFFYSFLFSPPYPRLIQCQNNPGIHRSRKNYQRKIRPGGGSPPVGDSASAISQESLDSWKPSVYWVMFYLFFTSIVVASLASVMYMQVSSVPQGAFLPLYRLLVLAGGRQTYWLPFFALVSHLW